MAFDSEMTGLSPVRVAVPVECDLPYGLSWTDVVPSLSDIAVKSLHESRAFRAYEKQGRFQGGANSCILTLQFPTQSGTAGESTVFVKQTPGQARESDRYRVLAGLGVPTPQLLVAVPCDGGEVIITEFVPRIGIDLGSEREVAQLLELLAMLNAVDSPAAAFALPPGRSREEMDALRRDGLARLALDPRARVDVEAWFTAFDRSRAEVETMPTALTHGEFSFQQSGWRREGRLDQLVIFDLATMGPRPRFSDIASILPAMARGTGRSEVELQGRYLEVLAHLTGSRLDNREDAWRELCVLRVNGQVNALHWLTHVYEPGSDELLQIAEQLRKDMVEAGLLG